MRILHTKPPTDSMSAGYRSMDGVSKPNTADGGGFQSSDSAQLGLRKITDTLDAQRGNLLAILAERREERERVAIWSGTDPRQHDPNNFRYLVHAVALEDSTTRKIQMINILKENQYNPSSNIDLTLCPDRIAEKIIFSASLIDQEHVETWTLGGFILEVVPEHILEVSPNDIGTPFWQSHAILREKLIAQGGPCYSPDELLRLSSPCKYNEVVLTGTRNGRSIKIRGVFIKVGTNGRELDPPLAKKLKQLASMKNWPIILLEEKAKKYNSSDPITLGVDYIAFNWEGKKCVLSELSSQGNPTAYLYDGNVSERIGPQELDSAIEFLRKEIEKNHPIEPSTLFEISKDKWLSHLETLLSFLR